MLKEEFAKYLDYCRRWSFLSPVEPREPVSVVGDFGISSRLRGKNGISFAVQWAVQDALKILDSYIKTILVINDRGFLSEFVKEGIDDRERIESPM